MCALKRTRTTKLPPAVARPVEAWPVKGELELIAYENASLREARSENARYYVAHSASLALPAERLAQLFQAAGMRNPNDSFQLTKFCGVFGNPVMEAYAVPFEHELVAKLSKVLQKLPPSGRERNFFDRFKTLNLALRPAGFGELTKAFAEGVPALVFENNTQGREQKNKLKIQRLKDDSDE